MTEDSGFEDDFNCNHFVTDKEFATVVDIIKTCEYLGSRREDPAVARQGVQEIVRKYCEEENIENMDFEDFILGKIDDIVQAHLNNKQLTALLEDTQIIFEEKRDSNDMTNGFSFSIDDDNFSDANCGKEEDNKLKHLTDMGFTKEEAENALKCSSNNLQIALEFLVPTTEVETSQTFLSSKENSLSFLRDIEEFQFLRYLVIQDPAQLQPLLISFGQSHPDIMKIINLNKEIFVNMIHEQTGARRSGRH